MLECCTNDGVGVPGANSGSSAYGQNPAVASFLSTMNSHMEAVSRAQNGFILSNPPLAALHNMTESKVPPASSLGLPGSPTALYGGGKPMLSAAAASAHTINDILSKPAGFPPLGLPRLNTMTNMYLSSPAAAAAAAAGRFSKPLTDLPGRTPIYWPGAATAAPSMSGFGSPTGPWRPHGSK